MPNIRKSLTVRINNRKSKTSEKKFESFVKALRGCVFRIEDGEFIRDRKGRKLRRKQVCDFIVAYQGKVGLFDVKDWDKKIIPSLFKKKSEWAQPNKLTSTQKQYNNFIELRDHGFNHTGFIFFKYDFDLLKSFSILKTRDILKNDLNPRLISRLDDLFIDI